MGVLKSAADLVYTIRFLKLLVTPFGETAAYEAGIIDEKGKRIKSFKTNTIDNRKAYKNNYTPFHRLVFNIKRLLSKAPGGSSKLASYAAALYLIKEHGNLSNKNINKINLELKVNLDDLLNEQTKWFTTEDDKLVSGTYRIKNDFLTKDYLDVVTKFDKIRVLESSYPVDSFLGVNIYEVEHILSGKGVYVSASDLVK